MKSKILTGALIAMMSFSVFACGEPNASSLGNLEDVAVQGDCIQYDYDELKAEAKVIAKVEVMDDLTEANSHLTYDEQLEHPAVSDFYATRKVKLIDVYKTSLELPDNGEIEIIERTAVADGQYLHVEGYSAMEKGQTYLVFLSDETASGELSVISRNNGIFDISKLNKAQGENEYYDIGVKALVEFESDLPEAEKQKILSAQVIKLPENKGEQDQMEHTEEIVVGEAQKNSKISYKLHYGETADGQTVIADLQKQ